MYSSLTHIWQALEQQAASIHSFQLPEAFAQNPDRFNKMHVECEGLLYDYSKNLIHPAIFDNLIKLAEVVDIHGHAQAMIEGKRINQSENRAVLHTALRQPYNPSYSLQINGDDVQSVIQHSLEKALTLADEIIHGHYQLNGQAITDLVHIGIGGSDLGPRMATHALKNYHQNIQVHFIANADPTEIANLLPYLNPHTTLFSIASKSFQTPETLMNSEIAKNWLLEQGIHSHQINKHFIAITSRSEAAIEFGISPNRILNMFDWVGGRYSVWSTIGFPLMVAIGSHHFREFLRGAYTMDQHFLIAPYCQNIPVLMALIGVWYNNFCDATAQTIVPYSHALNQFPAFLQQLDMESNGKSRQKDGRLVEHATGPVIFGEEGVNSQHAYFQLLHQGTHLIPIDFIVPLTTPHKEYNTQHRFVVANAFAQAEALMNGKTESQALNELQHLSQAEAQALAPQRTFSGNRPSSMLLLSDLSPFTLGLLIAAYEHKVFAQGIIWQINSFDQWGVEYGKQLAKTIEKELSNESTLQHDASTNALIEYYRKFHLN